MDINEIIAIDEKNYMPVFGKRYGICFEKGEGNRLYDTNGKSYVDFLGGIAVNALGYSDEGFKKAIHEQVDKLLHTSNYFYVKSQAKAAEIACELTGMDRAFFSNSGAEANEGALKLARKYFYNKGEPRSKVITMKNSFHGRTLATLSATGQEAYQKPYAPLLSEFVHVPFGDIDAIIENMDENTCAVMIEPIIGEGGVHVMPAKYLMEIRELCDKFGALLIFDEIQTGMGRTGHFLASQALGVKGDIVTLAKALGGGIPVGVFLATQEVASAFSQGDHGSTFGGNHIATAAALYMLEATGSEGMLKDVKTKGEYLKAALEDIRFDLTAITQIRGMGLMLGAQLSDEVVAADVIKALHKKGYIIGSAAGNTLRFVPPYTITIAEIDGLCEALTKIVLQ